MTTQKQVDDWYRHQAEGMQNAVPSWQSPPVMPPEPPPGLPWRYVLGWAIVGAMVWIGIFMLVAKVIEP